MFDRVLGTLRRRRARAIEYNGYTIFERETGVWQAEIGGVASDDETVFTHNTFSGLVKRLDVLDDWLDDEFMGPLPEGLSQFCFGDGSRSVFDLSDRRGPRAPGRSLVVVGTREIISKAYLFRCIRYEGSLQKEYSSLRMESSSMGFLHSILASFILVFVFSSGAHIASSSEELIARSKSDVMIRLDRQEKEYMKVALDMERIHAARAKADADAKADAENKLREAAAVSAAKEAALRQELEQIEAERFKATSERIPIF